MKKAIQVLIIILVPLSGFTQSIGEKLKSHQDQYPLEKVYLGHDRPYYAPGDTIWCQAWLLEGRSHLTFEEPSILHVDWYNEQGECLRSYLLKINEEGQATFEIPTSPEDSSGVYYLRAYTQYQRNFDPAYQFQKSILLTSEGPAVAQAKASNDFSLQFFPEGGYLVQNCLGKVAFLATDTSGRPIQVSGILQKRDGSPVQAIQSLHEGMGAFSFTPKPREEYQVVCTYQGMEKTFLLPAPLQEGYQLLVNNRKEAFLEFSIRPSPGKRLVGLQVVGHLRGQVFLDETVQVEEIYGKRIARTNLPSGLIQLTVFDQKDRPIAERLLFNRNAREEVEVQINKNPSVFNPRTKVDLELNTLQEQAPIDSRLSISVYNSELITPQKDGLNIQNYLWLQSDLQRPIPNAHQYLQEDTPQARLFLDYLLMTRGWRRFNWQEVLTGAPQILYPPEQHISIAGKVSQGRKQEPVKAEVFLSKLDQEDFMSLNLITQEDGLFIFEGFDFQGSTDLVLQANEYNPRKKKKRKKGEVKRVGNKNVDIERIELNALPFIKRQYDLPQMAPEEREQYAQAVENIQIAKAAYRDILIDEIAELEITESRLSENQKRAEELKADFDASGIPYTPMLRTRYLDDLPTKGMQYTDIYELIGAQYPSVVIDRRNPSDKKVIMPNRRNSGVTTEAGAALMIVDGMIIDQNTGGTIPPILPLDVKSISILSATQAFYRFGEPARGGAVIIMTREERLEMGNKSSTKIKGTLNFTHPGYYQARTFYSPPYPLPRAVSARPDLRTTLYWNPALKINDQGETFSFFTGDQTGTFTIQVEGISTDGIPFVHWEEIEVQN